LFFLKRHRPLVDNLICRLLAETLSELQLHTLLGFGHTTLTMLGQHVLSVYRHLPFWRHAVRYTPQTIVLLERSRVFCRYPLHELWVSFQSVHVLRRRCGIGRQLNLACADRRRYVSNVRIDCIGHAAISASGSSGSGADCERSRASIWSCPALSAFAKWEIDSRMFSNWRS